MHFHWISAWVMHLLWLVLTSGMEESGDQIQLSQFLAHSSTDKMDAVFKLLHAIFCLNLKCKAFSFCSKNYLFYSFHHIHMIKACTNYKFTILYLQKIKILRHFFCAKKHKCLGNSYHWTAKRLPTERLLCSKLPKVAIAENHRLTKW
jgi:hypothetical protein